MEPELLDEVQKRERLLDAGMFGVVQPGDEEAVEYAVKWSALDNLRETDREWYDALVERYTPKLPSLFEMSRREPGYHNIHTGLILGNLCELVQSVTWDELKVCPYCRRHKCLEMCPGN